MTDQDQDFIKSLARQATARSPVPEQFKDCINGTWKVVDGRVNVNGSVRLSELNLTRIPIKFGTVSRDFSCSRNPLTSLEGAPRSVGGDFYCQHTRLTSLEGAPMSVGGDFWCYDSPLTSLDGAPRSVGGTFVCNPGMPGLEEYNRRLRHA